MSFVRVWSYGESSGRLGLWSWRGTWRFCGFSSGSSVSSSRIADASGYGFLVSLASRIFGLVSSWFRWDSFDFRFLGKVGVDVWVLVGGGYIAYEVEVWVSRGFYCLFLIYF